jgi:hypothetical protein
MISKQINESAKYFLKPFVNNKDSISIITCLSKYEYLSLVELKALSNLPAKRLRQELIFLTKQNLVCFEQKDVKLWRISLNKSFIENLIYFPLYLSYIHKKYSNIEQMIIMNLLLNSSKTTDKALLNY